MGAFEAALRIGAYFLVMAVAGIGLTLAKAFLDEKVMDSFFTTIFGIVVGVPALHLLLIWPDMERRRDRRSG